MKEKLTILNGQFDVVSHADSLDWAVEFIRQDKRGWVVTVNVAILMMMRDDPFMQDFVDRAALVVADGKPLVWVSPLMGTRLPERVAGVELVTDLCERAAMMGFGVYFLGAKQSIVQNVADRHQAMFPELKICGVADGYFSADASRERAEAIARSGAQILFVAMGVPRQERFIDEHWQDLGVNLAVGVGGSFDVLAKARARAPKIIQKVGLEWAYRLAQEPRRLFRRYLVTNSQFIYHLGRDVISRAPLSRHLRRTKGPHD